jgi:hypothetical protein
MDDEVEAGQCESGNKYMYVRMFAKRIDDDCEGEALVFQR